MHYLKTTYPKLLALLLLMSPLAGITNAIAQSATKPKLIVRADDLGATHAINVASMESVKEGIATSVEVIVVGPWLPETIKLLEDYPQVDVGLHMALTSEWDNVKWRPLTDCPSLTDENGFFLPMIWPNPAYPGLAIREREWNIDEIEQEFRAQIEYALKNFPQLSHITGHMGCTRFDPQVAELTDKLTKEYGLLEVPSGPDAPNALQGVSYDGPKGTYAEKEKSFLSMLEKLEDGKTYLFVDHPAYDDAETQAIHHVGYENVAADRQGVTDLFTSSVVKEAIDRLGIQLVDYNDAFTALPRSSPEEENVDPSHFDAYFEAVEEAGQELHSIMVLRHGKVVLEKWLGEHGPEENHVLHSVSKTFTSTAIGFAVAENLLSVSDKVISFFPDDLPDEISPHLAELEVRDLLTMTVGHEVEATRTIREQVGSWELSFLATPIPLKPGTYFLYNTIGSYMLSAIMQKVTGETLVDYLSQRLFRKLGIQGAKWETSPTGINTGGWGLYLTTEDMAKMGQFMLQKGSWKGEQVLPAAWFDEATTAHITGYPVWTDKSTKPADSDWLQGYGYQIWRCRHNAFRADGLHGQFIIVIPEKDAVVVTTAYIPDMQAEINLIWDHILPALK